jgi:hypothetical protein
MAVAEDLNIMNLADLDDIGDFKPLPPVGKYVVRLTEAVGKLSKKGKPQVECLFEIQDGPHAGDELKAWYGVDVATYTRKDGSEGKRSFGISKIRRLLEAAGEPIPDQGQIPTGTLKAAQVIAAKIIKKKLAGKKLEIESKDEPMFDGKGSARTPKLNAEGKPEVFRSFIPLGLASGGLSVADIEEDEYADDAA